MKSRRKSYEIGAKWLVNDSVLYRSTRRFSLLCYGLNPRPDCVPSANTLVRRVNESAFASVVQARPCPAFGRPVHLRGRPHRLQPGTSPHALRIPPHDGHPALRRLQVGGFRSALACFRLSLSVAVGTAVARCPPHRPVLALLAHTVPTWIWDVWRRSARWDRGAGSGPVVAGQPGAPESAPRSYGCRWLRRRSGCSQIRSTSLRNASQSRPVARNGVILEIPPHHLLQPLHGSSIDRVHSLAAVALEFPSAWLPCVCRSSFAATVNCPSCSSSHRYGGE